MATKLTTNDAAIIRKQRDLLTYNGKVRANLTAYQARKLVTEINRLRSENGWPPLDMRGRRR